jgi:hypothetical protein
MTFSAPEKQRIGGAPLERVFRELFGSTGSWFDTDRATIDQNTGKLGAFIDYMDSSHRLEQTSSAAQCAPVAPLVSGAFNGRPVATATGAQWYQSTRAAATWNYLHNGTGGAAVVVGAYTTAAAATEMWFATTGLVSDAPGLSFGRGAGNTELLRIGRVGGSNFAYAWQPTPITATPSAWLLSHTNTPSAALYGSVTGRSVLDIAAYTVAPLAVDATTTLSLFARNPAAPAAFLNGSLVAAYFFPRHLSAADRDVVALWVLQKYGVTLT